MFGNIWFLRWPRRAAQKQSIPTFSFVSTNVKMVHNQSILTFVVVPTLNVVQKQSIHRLVRFISVPGLMLIQKTKVSMLCCCTWFNVGTKTKVSMLCFCTWFNVGTKTKVNMLCFRTWFNVGTKTKVNMLCFRTWFNVGTKTKVHGYALFLYMV